ncbi:hypothetical protein BH10PSE14_BH10PSE14_15510 [soil metagenome]
MAKRPLLLSRRALIGGVAASAGLMLSGCNEQPPTYGNLLRMGDNLTYNAQRLLLSRTALAREYDRSAITSMPAIGTFDPARSDGGFTIRGAARTMRRCGAATSQTGGSRSRAAWMVRAASRSPISSG